MGACHPDDLPEGYHTAARGQQLCMFGRRCAWSAAHERPRGRAAPGRRDGTRNAAEVRWGSGAGGPLLGRLRAVWAAAGPWETTRQREAAL